jgi:hypothetical protein
MNKKLVGDVIAYLNDLGDLGKADFERRRSLVTLLKAQAPLEPRGTALKMRFATYPYGREGTFLVARGAKRTFSNEHMPPPEPVQDYCTCGVCKAMLASGVDNIVDRQRKAALDAAIAAVNHDLNDDYDPNDDYYDRYDDDRGDE